MKNLKILTLSLLLNLPIVMCAAEILPRAISPEPRLVSYDWMPLAEWFHLHADDVAEAEKGEARVLFLGDSIVQGWNGPGAKYWNKHFAPMKAANAGIGGDYTQNVLWRLENGGVGNLLPERIILLIGTNNFGHFNDTPENVAMGIHAIIVKLRSDFPTAKILLMGVFPTDEMPGTINRQKIESLNRQISVYGQMDDVSFMDIGDRFLDQEGRIPAELMADFLHPTEKGYQIWTEAIFEWIEATPLPGQ